MMKNYSRFLANFGSVTQNNVTQNNTIIIQPTNEAPTVADKVINRSIDEYKENIEFNPIDSLKKLQKIEQDNFDHIDDKTKYRLLVNIAVAYERQDKAQETAEYLIKAKEYSENPDAYYHAIYGYLVKNNTKQAETLYSELKNKNPQNDFVFMVQVLFNSFNKTYPLEKNLPKSKLDNPDIIRTLAICYYEANKNRLALIWFEKYYRSNSEDMNMQSLYARSIFSYIAVQHEILFGRQWQKDDKEKLDLAIQLFAGLWEKYDSKKNKKLHLSVGLNLCMSLQLAEKQQEANIIAEELLSIDSANFEICYYCADVFNRQEKYDLAINTLSNIFGENTKTDFQLIEILLHKKRYKDALDKIEKLDRSLLDDEHRQYSNIFQSIAIYYEQNKDASYKFIDNCHFSIFECQLNIFYFYNDITKDKKRASTQLQLIEDSLTDDTAYHCKLKLADIYYSIGGHQKAIHLYQQLNINKPSSALRRLLKSLLKVNDRIGIKRILDNFDNSDKDSDLYLETAANFYFLTGQLNKAELQINKAIKKYPDNLHYRLLWINILKRTQKGNKVEKYLNTEPKFLNASPDDQMELVKLFRGNRQLEVAIKLGYETLRNNWDNANCHVIYSMGTVMLCPESPAILSADRIAIDTTFTITNNFGETKVYTIADNADASFNEIDSKHYVAKEAIGEKVNDTFITQQTQEKKWTIKRITSKYIGLAIKSMNKYNDLFPDNTNMYPMQIRQGKELEDISPLLDNVNESTNRVHETYQKHNTPVSCLARLSKENVIKLWESLLASQSVKVNINTPTQTIVEPLKNDNGYIVDAITLYFIFKLNIHEDIKQYLDNIAIVQATLDVFLQLKEENISIPYITIKKQEDQYYSHDITKQDIKNSNNFMQKLHDWASDNCQIIPAYGNLANQQNQLSANFDLSTVETLIAAESSARSLLTDDRNLRFMCDEFKIKSLCSKDALYCNDATKNQKYYNYLHQLRLMNCVYIPLEIGELWYWIEQFKTIDDLVASNEMQAIKKYRDDFINIVNFDQSYFAYMQYSKNNIINSIFYILIADETPCAQEKINWIMDNLYIDYENIGFSDQADKYKWKVLEVISFLTPSAILDSKFINSKESIKKYVDWVEQNFLQNPTNHFIQQIAGNLFRMLGELPVSYSTKDKDIYIKYFINTIPASIKKELNKLLKK